MSPSQRAGGHPHSPVYPPRIVGKGFYGSDARVLPRQPSPFPSLHTPPRHPPAPLQGSVNGLIKALINILWLRISVSQKEGYTLHQRQARG